MSRIEFSITFTDDDGNVRCETQEVEISHPTDHAGEQRLTHNFFAELKVATRDQVEPTHNAVALAWLEFPNRPTDIANFFDVWNSQELWRELATLVMSAEADLVLAQAFKTLEPHEEPLFENDAAINDLYYIHDRKMALLHEAVYGLIKTQALVDRLLHESLGGDLVDTSKLGWEKDELTRKKIKKGLAAKHTTRQLSQTDFDAINQALALPENHPNGPTVVTYRNRLTHHVRPSVDYSMFYSELNSRVGEEVKDAIGNVVGRRHILLAKQPVQYRFEELYAAFSEYLDAVVAMLQQFSTLEILRR